MELSRASLLVVAGLEHAVIREAVARALGEDRGAGDLTSMVAVPAEVVATARLVSRERCVLAGVPVAEAVFREADAGLIVNARSTDGAVLEPGAVVMEVHGPARGLLGGERCALNFLQQLSAVATVTRRFVDAVAGTGVRILDTRKTLPGLRALQKYAVRCGGGVNHRFGLYDAFLFKDNHLALMGPPSQWANVIQQARAFEPDARIEVEAETLDHVAAIANLGVDLILLDNMSTATMREAIRIIAGRAQTEASGNMTLDRVREVAETGVDFISVGALTHTLQAIDMSLEIVADPL